MLETLIILLLFQFLGEALVRSLGLPLPGAVAGMLLLFACLCLRRGSLAVLHRHVPALLTHMSLLFIPAGAGIIAFWPQLSRQPLAMALVLLLSTLTAFLVPLLLVRALLRTRSRA